MKLFVIENWKCLNDNINELSYSFWIFWLNYLSEMFEWEVVVWFQMMIDLKSIYEVIEWCIDMLNDVCNEVKVWSRRSIFRKENTMLRLLLGCIDLWVSCEWDDPDSTNIMESNRWSYSVGENQIDEVIQLVRVEGGPFGWAWGLKELIRAYQMDLPYHMKMMRYWDNYAHGCVGFTAIIWQVHVSGC